MNVVFLFDNLETSPILTNWDYKEIYYNDLKQADNSFNLTIPYSIRLANLFKTTVNQNIKAVVYDDTSRPIFTGYVEQSFSFQKTQRNQPISIQLVSPSFILDQDLNETQIYIEKSVDFIITDLLKLAGFSEIKEIQIPAIIPFCQFEKGSSIKGCITDLCFEFSKIWDFDNTGSFFTSDILDLPDTKSITQHFDGTNSRNSIQIKAKERDTDFIECNWESIQLKKNVLLFTDTTGQDGSHKCKQVVPGKGYFAQTEKNLMNLDSELGEVLYCTNITPKIKAENGIVWSASKFDGEIDLGNQVLFTAKNNNSWDCYLYQIDIYGDAYISTGTNSNLSTTGTKAKSIDLKFLSTDEQVKDFTAKLANYYKYSNFEIKLDSQENFPLGSFVSVSDYGIGTYYGRIIQKKYTNSKEINYVIQTIQEFEPATVSDTVRVIHSTISKFADFEPPTVPSITGATAQTDGSILLTFTASTDAGAGVYQYHIYRRKQNEEKYQQVQTVENDGSAVYSVSDKPTEAGQVYIYGIKAVDKVNNVSALSDTVSISPINARKPSAPTNVVAVADNPDYITITWNKPSNSPEPASYYHIYIEENGKSEKVGETAEAYYQVNIDLQKYGYMEKDDFAKLTVKVCAVSAWGIESNKTAASINTTNYGTWKPSIPVFKTSTNSRNCFLEATSSPGCYGSTNLQIQISKDGKSWKSPAENAEHIWKGSQAFQESLTNKTAVVGSIYTWDDLPESWSGSSEFLEVYQNFTQVLPLNLEVVKVYRTNAQGDRTTFYEATALDTVYQYRCRYVNVNSGNKSEWSQGKAITARATNPIDIVKNAISSAQIVDGSITAEKLFAQTISAISSNLGLITDGAIKSSSFNYWALSDFTDDDGNRFSAGDFRVGSNSGDYFECLKQPDGNYKISLKADSFEINQTGVEILGNIELIDGTKKVRLDGKGLQITENGSIKGQFTKDSLGNLVISNTEVSTEASFSPEISYTDTVFHVQPEEEVPGVEFSTEPDDIKKIVSEYPAMSGSIIFRNQNRNVYFWYKNQDIIFNSEALNVLDGSSSAYGQSVIDAFAKKCGLDASAITSKLIV